MYVLVRRMSEESKERSLRGFSPASKLLLVLFDASMILCSPVSLSPPGLLHCVEVHRRAVHPLDLSQGEVAPANATWTPRILERIALE